MNLNRLLDSKSFLMFSGTTVGSLRRTSWTRGSWQRFTKGVFVLSFFSLTRAREEFSYTDGQSAMDPPFRFVTGCFSSQRTGTRASLPEERKAAEGTSTQDSGNVSLSPT